MALAGFPQRDSHRPRQLQHIARLRDVYARSALPGRPYEHNSARRRRRQGRVLRAHRHFKPYRQGIQSAHRLRLLLCGREFRVRLFSGGQDDDGKIRHRPAHRGKRGAHSRSRRHSPSEARRDRDVHQRLCRLHGSAHSRAARKGGEPHCRRNGAGCGETRRGER